MIDKKNHLSLCILSQILERATGIEPASKAWEALVLPLNYTRFYNRAQTSAYGKCATLNEIVLKDICNFKLKTKLTLMLFLTQTRPRHIYFAFFYFIQIFHCFFFVFYLAIKLLQPYLFQHTAHFRAWFYV